MSHKVALALHDWLPSVLQAVEPYVSSEDIDKGARWNPEISRELQDSSYGILCVVPDNVNEPWLNFEAGALSKSFESARVSPFLFGLQPADVPAGPLVQFQFTVFNLGDVTKLVQSINHASGEAALDPPRVAEAVEVWWPSLSDRLTPLLEELGRGEDGDDASRPRPGEEVLAEILELARDQQRLLGSPERLLPPDYLELALGRAGKVVDREALRAIDRSWSHLVDAVIGSKRPIDQAELVRLLTDVEEPLVHVLRTLGRRRPRSTLARFYSLFPEGDSPDD